MIGGASRAWARALTALCKPRSGANSALQATHLSHSMYVYVCLPTILIIINIGIPTKMTEMIPQSAFYKDLF